MPKKAKAEAKPEAPNVESLQPLLEGMITLLGRLVYPPDSIVKIVTFKKRNPEQYIAIYNFCDGEHTGSEIAKTFNQDQGGLSRILADWKELGIVYEITKKGGRFYKKLYTLEEVKQSETPKETKSETKSAEPQVEQTPSPNQPEVQQAQSQG